MLVVTISTLFPYTTLFRSKVLTATGNQQTPWDSSSLTGRFFFKAPEETAQTPTPTPAAAPTSGNGATTAEAARSEEHTSELQSRFDLVCRLLLEKKNRSEL